MELKDFDRKLMMFDGIDFYSSTDSTNCNFRLDGIVYSAIEDPEDGWRSSMRELVTHCNNDMLNTFDPIRIICMYDSEYGDILKLIDVVNGNTILEVGTRNTDNYYPCFVADFIPKNIHISKSN